MDSFFPGSSIDRDIRAYQDAVELHGKAMSAAPENRKSTHRALQSAAIAVRNALRVYEAVLDEVRNDPTAQVPLTTGPDAGEAAALTWIMQEELHISASRLPDLKPEDARREIDDIAKVAGLLQRLGGTDPLRMSEIHRMIGAMEMHVAGREAKAKDVQTRGAMEAEAISTYMAVAGQVVLMTEVECYDANRDMVKIKCDPPAVGRVVRRDGDLMRRQVIRWTTETHLEPSYDIEILEPHPAFAGLRPSWIHGSSRTTDGDVKAATAFTVADIETQNRWRDAKGLADDAVAPPSSPTP